MSHEEIVEKIREILTDEPERAIISECVYKVDDFRSFSFTVSDSKDKGIEIPYFEYTEEDKNVPFKDLLERRNSDEMKNASYEKLKEIQEILSKLNLDFSDDDVLALAELSKPVIMVSRKK